MDSGNAICINQRRKFSCVLLTVVLEESWIFLNQCFFNLAKYKRYQVTIVILP